MDTHRQKSQSKDIYAEDIMAAHIRHWQSTALLNGSIFALHGILVPGGESLLYTEHPAVHGTSLLHREHRCSTWRVMLLAAGSSA